MIGRTESTRLSDRVLARLASLLAFLAVLGCFAPAAPAFTPTPSGQFVSDTGSGEEAAQRSRFNDGQSGLQLALRAQEASDRGAYEEAGAAASQLSREDANTIQEELTWARSQ